MKKVLILEDEEQIRSFAVNNLQRAGYETLESATGNDALELLKENPDVDVVVLDLTLPDVDGLDICCQLRAEHKHLGILMLIPRTQEMDKITGLMTGADDYLTKPFSPAELTGRLDTLVRRVRGNLVSVSEVLSHGPFLLNTRDCTLEKLGQRIRLTYTEYLIMKLLMQHPGKALSREEILSRVWGEEYQEDKKILDMNIRRLRIKLENDPYNPEYISTVWGYGFKWGC